jgi:hypothetical protein
VISVPFGHLDGHVKVVPAAPAAAGVVLQGLSDGEDVAVGLREPDTQHERERLRVCGEVAGRNHDLLALHEHEFNIDRAADIHGLAGLADHIVRERPHHLRGTRGMLH